MASGFKYSEPTRAVCTCITVLLVLIGITVLVLWLVYHPHKPSFTIVGVAVNELNTTAPPLVSTSFQFTIQARNPNRRVSIYYDRLLAYVSYKDQTITSQLMLPPLYQEKHSTITFSPILGGTLVPVSVELINELLMDETYGVLALKVNLLGRLRWKAGAIRTGHYGIYVKCDILIGLKKGALGQVPLLGSQECLFDI